MATTIHRDLVLLIWVWKTAHNISLGVDIIVIIDFVINSYFYVVLKNNFNADNASCRTTSFDLALTLNFKDFIKLEQINKVAYEITIFVRIFFVVP